MDDLDERFKLIVYRCCGGKDSAAYSHLRHCRDDCVPFYRNHLFTPF